MMENQTVYIAGHGIKMINLYETLQVKKSATSKQIKAAYRKLAVKYHPDKNEGKESQEFLDITLAYTILMDRKNRAEYDTTGQYDNQVLDTNRLAISSLASIMLTIVKSPTYDPVHHNLFESISQTAEIAIAKKEVEETAYNGIIEKMEIINERISGKDNMFNDIIRNDLQKQKVQLSAIERDLKVLNRAQSIVTEYKYKTDEEDFIAFIGFRTTASGTTGAAG